MNNEFSGMILAAGFGKRMLPLTKSLPKPLIKVNDISLLDNAIDFLKKIGCKQIIINTHYQYEKIHQAIEKRKDKEIINLIYEEDLLDTGGGVKNAIPYFNNNHIIIINCDVFWIDKNINDTKLLIKNYFKFCYPQLLLVDKKNAYGLKKKGDFYLSKGLVKRYKKEKIFYYYSGLQILNYNIFKSISDSKFSLNLVWDKLIKDEVLFGKIMESKWYHVGDVSGLSVAKKLIS